jgi:hypothetical protein
MRDSFTGELMTSFFYRVLAPKIVVRKFARQDDIALSVAITFLVKGMIPELLVIGTES